LNPLDRIAGYVSPKWGLKRIAARKALEFGASYYSGAKSSRLSNNWSTGQESADTAMGGGELQTLRNRSRDLNRNDPVASGLTGTFQTNVIGVGLKPQSRIDYKALSITPEAAKAFQAQAEKAWKKMGTWASASRKLNIEEIQSLAVRQIIESGEFLAVRRAISTGQGRPYYLALDVIEPDRLKTPSDKRRDKSVRYGIDFNQRGEPKRYFIQKEHPGDDRINRIKRQLDYTTVRARDEQGRQNVFHIFPTLRPGQTRGIPFFAPVIDRFKVMADYIEATLVAARVAACFAAFVKSENAYAVASGRSDETNDESQKLEYLEPGTIDYLDDGQDIIFAKPEQPGTTFDSFCERLLRMIGASLGLPYELVAKDFSKTNYSSAKAALEQAYRFFKTWQNLIRDHLCQPFWELLLEEAWLRGELTAPGFQKNQWEYTRATWIAPPWPSLDPLKDAKANEVAKKEGFKTSSRIIMETTGEDFEEVADQRAYEKEYEKSRGLVDEPETISE